MEERVKHKAHKAQGREKREHVGNKAREAPEHVRYQTREAQDEQEHIRHKYVRHESKQGK